MKRNKLAAKNGRLVFGVAALLAALLLFSFDAAAGPSAPEKASTVTIGPAFTGHWYDPTQSGHGIFVEILSDNRFLAWWFAFNPEGTQQSWFGGVGTYAGDTATISDVQIATGGKWIPNFDPSKVVRTTWGSVTFKFTDCNSGRVDFTSTYGNYGSNHLDLTRLTMPAGLKCPVSGTSAAKGIWTGTTSAGENVFAIVVDDGTYYVLLSQPGNATDARVIQGTSTGAGGAFSSSDAVDFPIANADETGGTALPASIGGTYVAQSALQLTISTQIAGTRTASAAYVAGSDQSPALAAAAGNYSGVSGHTGGRRIAHFTLDADGNITGTNDAGCRYSGTMTPRSAQNAFDWTLRATNSACIFGNTGTAIFGVMYYDATARQIHGFAPYDDRYDQYYLIGTKQ